jgi:hypothetical protein
MPLINDLLDIGTDINTRRLMAPRVDKSSSERPCVIAHLST